MSNKKLASVVHLCSVLLGQVALALNGGEPLPKVKGPVAVVQQNEPGLSKQAPHATAGGKRGCAIIGCTRPNRTKGYCGAHYQKLRMLVQTGRRPAAWKDNANPGTVADVMLPRGRAGSKALAELRAKKGAA